ncbi:MAG TPA: 50S ribosomal protein L16 [Candidatus Pacearchaeota archaeon]|jgi:large subunit ribosomal protein L16|nr:50S ribosomal protein L16 [Candidatus Pacearchaeota archaeon]HRR94533.1 50S ribosomal protein L16 [Candidatus Paceibacterota bacterium]HPC30398.1 50S ribosomal protein L16 [Candidatus Pacearchaeota archaeon]HQG09108.1 50S ribosomal protein L16 [Candidatus Pacearchaeota archaeon]HQH20092.1 50S ribosomal protein L16 [Candidatus Pacearchaeota archaeon]
MLAPKRLKHRKHQKGRRINRLYESRGTTLSFGSFGLKAMDAKWITANQIEAGRRAIIRYLRKGGKLWVRVFPDKVMTKKGQEVPMGGGKGSPDHYVCPVRPGRIIFELEGISEADAREALRKAGTKLPIKTKFIKN